MSWSLMPAPFGDGLDPWFHGREAGVARPTGDFLSGGHGWFDKRLKYEESLRMPLPTQCPDTTAPESTGGDIAVDVDFAPTLSTSSVSRYRTMCKAEPSRRSSTIRQPTIGRRRCTTSTGRTVTEHTTALLPAGCAREPILLRAVS